MLRHSTERVRTGVRSEDLAGGTRAKGRGEGSRRRHSLFACPDRVASSREALGRPKISGLPGGSVATW